MIMARNEDGTYSQVGFVKDNAGIDTEYIYDKDGDIVFEKGFTRETSGTVPLTINGIGKDLKAWSITGNTVQNGTPTPENPVEVVGVGDYDSDTGMYKIPVVTSADGTEPITTTIYLPTPLYSGEVMRSDGSREVKWGKIVLTGEEKIAFTGTAGTSYRYDFTNIKTISQIKYARKNSKITHFEQCNMPTIDVVGYDWHGGSFHLIIMTTQSTINKFKDWLKSQYEAGTPVTVWYQLATPTTETFTAPQIPTLNGTTIIDVDTAVKPTEMYTKYKSSK